MKKLVLLFAVVLLSSVGVIAQERQRATPEERAKRQTETLVKELGLTDDQKEKVYEINLKYAQPVDKTARANRDTRREDLRKVSEERTVALKKVLDKDQQKKLDDLQKQTQRRRN